MKSKDLLLQLSRMEHSLHDFSFDELTSTEAAFLKKSFETFRLNLEAKIFEPTAVITADKANELHSSEQNTSSDDTNINALIARVSHEIRTPLNGIVGFTNLLLEDQELNTEQHSQISAIKKASHSLMEIISELLEYSKLSSGLEHFESIDFNLRNLIGDTMYLCETLVSNKEIELHKEINSDIPEVLVGDPSKLTQILLNILGNAIKFVEKGDIALKVTLKKIRDGKALLEFSITDTGIGIARENLPHIFDSFKQAEANTFAKYGGSGLGLHIVKQIITNLEGTIGVTSELGVGTTFTFTIPYTIGKGSNVSARQNLPNQGVEKQKTTGLKVLVFEDNMLNQRLMEAQLKNLGCDMYITDDAYKGLEILTNTAIDVVLMDLRMPGMDGFEVSHLIRQSEEEWCNVPIVAVSADFSAHDKERCNLLKINDFMLKPYSNEELSTVLIKNKKTMDRTLQVDSETINPYMKEVKSDSVDLSNVLEECMGEMSLLEELVTLYKQNALEFIGAAKLHLKNRDITQLKFAAHKIKAGLRMMNSNNLLTIIEQIENCCKTNKDAKHLLFLYNCFVEEYPNTEKSIEIALKKLK